MPLYDLTFDTDPDVYTIDLLTPIDQLEDTYALHLMRSTMLALADKVRDDALRISTDDFSDDDTDYMPARSGALMQLISALTSLDSIAYNPADMLRELLKNHDFVTDMMTADMRLPLSISYKD